MTIPVSISSTTFCWLVAGILLLRSLCWRCSELILFSAMSGFDIYHSLEIQFARLLMPSQARRCGFCPRRSLDEQSNVWRGMQPMPKARLTTATFRLMA